MGVNVRHIRPEDNAGIRDRAGKMNWLNVCAVELRPPRHGRHWVVLSVQHPVALKHVRVADNAPYVRFKRQIVLFQQSPLVFGGFVGGGLHLLADAISLLYRDSNRSKAKSAVSARKGCFDAILAGFALFERDHKRC